jgi:NADPH-dependent ferric siderophore reductase
VKPAIGSTEGTAAKAPGRLNKALLRLLMNRVTVVASEWLADRFRMLTLEGPGFKGVAWTPGQKVQIAMGSAFVTRTYTPIEWDAATGRTRVLGYAHGEGPGSAWLLGLETGDECDVFGPRNSLDVGRDETSIGLAHALVQQNPARAVSCRFEVGDVERCLAVTAHLGLDDAMLFSRSEDEAHLKEMEAALPVLAEAGATFVLTGKADTIQQLRQTLKGRAVPGARIVAKAYWSPGKKGLD